MKESLILFRFIKFWYILITVMLLIASMVFLVQAVHEKFSVHFPTWEETTPVPPGYKVEPALAGAVVPFDDLPLDTMWGSSLSENWAVFFMYSGLSLAFQLCVFFTNWILTGKMQSPSSIFLKKGDNK